MRKIVTCLILAATAIFILAEISGAQDATPLNDLIENGKSFDGKTVEVRGEAIGEALERGGYAWVNINDQTNAMGIWLTIADAGKVKVFGDYKHKGDMLEITGVFHRACGEHGGDMDIHAVSINIEEKGYMVKEEIQRGKTAAGVGLTLVTLIIASACLAALKKHSKTEA